MTRLFHLPSGAIAELDGSGPPEIGGVFAGDAALCRVRLSRAGHPLGWGTLALSDFHTLRSLLRALEVIPDEPVELQCENCDSIWRVRPCSSLELGPYRDGELSDPELDASFDFDRAIALHTGSEAGEAASRRVRLGPLTVQEVQPLHLALARGRPLRWTRRLVRATGILAIDGQGDARELALELRRASEVFLEQLGELFEAAHYPARLTVGHRCPECHMLAWVGAPAGREFTEHAALHEVQRARAIAPDRAEGRFMTPDDFESLVRRVAAPIRERVGGGHVDLVVLDGPADCDEGGEPLLGAYYPPDPEALPPEPAEIRLYYRTFQNLHETDGPYDVAGEIEQTLRHELVHHAGHLAGSDPLDEEERGEIAGEYRRRVGRRESLRRAAAELIAELAGFLRGTWWVWVLVLMLTILFALFEG